MWGTPVTERGAKYWPSAGFQICSNKEAYFWWEHVQTAPPPLTPSLWPALRPDRHFHFDEGTCCIKHETLEMEYELRGGFDLLSPKWCLREIDTRQRRSKREWKTFRRGGGERRAALKWSLDSIVLLFYYSTDEKVQDSRREIFQW